jgi:hypothetical protein
MDLDFSYVEAEKRVNDLFSSVNSGDIILLANVRHSYQFGRPYSSQHGSLTRADGIVPVAFGHLKKSADDTTDLIEDIRAVVGTSAEPASSEQMLESPAIREFFLPGGP